MQSIVFNGRRSVLAIGLTGLFTGTVAVADSDARTPVFKNDYVTVERISLSPGESLPPHPGAKRIVYSLSDYTIAWTEGGETQRKSWREGDVHSHEALEHAVENVGNTNADYLLVIRTDKALPAVDVGEDASQVAGGYAAELAEFDDARVLRITLPAGSEQPMHDGTARLSYALNDQRLRFITEDGEPVEASHVTGEAHWHDAGRHAVENIGDAPARYVLFAFD